MRILRTALLFTVLQAALCSEEPGFRFKREILPLGKGPQRLEVDLTLLAGVAPDFRDFRIQDENGRERPYVIVAPAPMEASWRSGNTLPLPATKESSGFELDLGTPRRTSRLMLDGFRGPFLKRYRMEGSGDRTRWTELVAEGSLFDLPEDGLKLLQIDYPEGEYRYLRVIWDDHSSARLPLPRTASVQVHGAGGSASLAVLDVQPRPSEPGTSRFILRLPGPRLPIVALRLTVGGKGPLMREVRVLEARLQAGGLAPRELGRCKLRRTERAGIAAADLRVPVAVPECSELELSVDDGNNPPLDLKNVQAELSPQPWIYFESDGSKLQANFGDPKRVAPRYDLEALQAQLQPSHAAKAQWGPTVVPVLKTQGQTIYDPGPGANQDPAGFKTRRSIPDTEPGLAALVLDAHVLSVSRGLRDLRILDREHHQIPYLLEQRDGPFSLPLTMPVRQTKGRISRYNFDLTQTGLQDGRLVLETKARVFSRVARLHEEGRAAGTERVLAEALWNHDQPESDPPPLVMGFSEAEGRRVVLTLDEGDNQPLTITHATLLLPGWRLRFFHPGQGLTLVYDRDLGEPHYDLALLADRLRAAPVRELELGGITSDPLPETRTPMNTATVFWVALAGAVAILLVILARLLRKPEQGPPSPD